jgi:hypothetical protein
MMKCISRRALTVLALTAGVGVLAAVPAVAAVKTNVRCVGSADFCGAKVSIASGGGGTSNCTSNETNTTFTSKGDNEPHPLASIRETAHGFLRSRLTID